MPTHGPIDRKAPAERIQLDDHSWVDVVRQFAHDTEATFERLVNDVRWAQNRQISGGRKLGDLDVMGGRCQVDWYHGVPKLPQCGPKISVVWR